MNFKFTKILLFNSILFAGATSWDAYSMNYRDNIGHSSIDLKEIAPAEKKQLMVEIKSNIEETTKKIQSAYKQCNTLMKEINGEQLEETYKSIKNNLEEVLSRSRCKSLDDEKFEDQREELLIDLTSNLYNKIEDKQENGTVRYVLLQDFMKSIYLIIQTAVTISNHPELLERIQSMPEDPLTCRLSDGSNAKQLLEVLFSCNNDNEKKKYLLGEFSDKLFKTVTSERINSITHYCFDDEVTHYIICLSSKMQRLYGDLNKILKHCLRDS